MVTAGAEGCPSPAVAVYSHATTHGSCSTAAPVRLWTSSPAQRPSAGRGETFHTAASSPGQPGTQEPRHATPRGFQPPTKPARGKEPLCCAGVRSQHPHGEPHRPPAPPGPYHGQPFARSHVSGADVRQVHEVHGLADHGAVDPSPPLLLRGDEGRQLPLRPGTPSVIPPSLRAATHRLWFLHDAAAQLVPEVTHICGAFQLSSRRGGGCAAAETPVCSQSMGTGGGWYLGGGGGTWGGDSEKDLSPSGTAAQWAVGCSGVGLRGVESALTPEGGCGETEAQCLGRDGGSCRPDTPNPTLSALSRHPRARRDSHGTSPLPPVQDMGRMLLWDGGTRQ